MRLATKRVDKGWARSRRRVSAKYLEVAEVVAAEDGEAINVCVGLCVLAGIGAGDAICAAALGEHYCGQDHSGAAVLLGRVDKALGNKLRALIALKPGSHYGNALLSPGNRNSALRVARDLIDDAHRRTT